MFRKKFVRTYVCGKICSQTDMFMNKDVREGVWSSVVMLVHEYVGSTTVPPSLPPALSCTSPDPVSVTRMPYQAYRSPGGGGGGPHYLTYPTYWTAVNIRERPAPWADQPAGRHNVSPLTAVSSTPTSLQAAFVLIWGADGWYDSLTTNYYAWRLGTVWEYLNYKVKKKKKKIEMTCVRLISKIMFST